jgi:hypothetical protein
MCYVRVILIVTLTLCEGFVSASNSVFHEDSRYVIEVKVNMGQPNAVTSNSVLYYPPPFSFLTSLKFCYRKNV